MVGLSELEVGDTVKFRDGKTHMVSKRYRLNDGE